MAKKKKLVTGEWSKEEVKVLKKAFGNTITKEVAAKLNRKPESVETKAHRMGLKKTNKQGTVRRMGISSEKKYAQALVEKEIYPELEAHAKSCGFPSFASWAGTVLVQEMKEPKHLRKLS